MMCLPLATAMVQIAWFSQKMDYAVLQMADSILLKAVYMKRFLVSEKMSSGCTNQM
jgi:hypothetical protein